MIETNPDTCEAPRVDGELCGATNPHLELDEFGFPFRICDDGHTTGRVGGRRPYPLGSDVPEVCDTHGHEWRWYIDYRGKTLYQCHEGCTLLPHHSSMAPR